MKLFLRELNSVMQNKNPDVLVVDDDKYLLEVFKIALESIQFNIEAVSDPTKAVKLLDEKNYDLVFLDLRMHPIDGMEILKKIKTEKPKITVIIISGNSGIEDALKAVDLGAYHILQKPVQIKELQFFAKKAWEYHALKSELSILKEASLLAQKEYYITKNSEMQKAFETALKVADSKLNILLQGESGTGKKLLSELIHTNSNRANHPMVIIQCSCSEENLLQELDPKQENNKLQEAKNGTILLDEVSSLPISVQTKLYEIIQNNAKKFNIRFISTSNINLEETLKEKLLREDLYYRLNEVNIKLIALRERPEDIQVLIDHFVAEISKEKKIRINSDAMHLLKLYRWPGNVLELKNTLYRAARLTKNDTIDSMQLPDEIQLFSVKDDKELISLEEVELAHIKKVLNRTSDYKVAARILGIDAATLWRKRKKYNI
jgi:NtrC-family two-component system response regulator AlgB